MLILSIMAIVSFALVGLTLVLIEVFDKSDDDKRDNKISMVALAFVAATSFLHIASYFIHA